MTTPNRRILSFVFAVLCLKVYPYENKLNLGFKCSMFQTSLVIPICLFVIELYQACHNKTYHKAENIAEAGSQLPYILEKMALNPILRSFFLSAWQNLHFNLFTTIR